MAGADQPRIRELDVPLGMTIKSRPERTAPRFSAAQAFGTLAAVVLVGASTAIALRASPFRIPQQTVVSVPTQQASGTGGQGVSNAPAPARDGPQIIRVQPDRDGQGAATAPLARGATLTQEPRVAHMPDRDLVEDSPSGPLPKRAEDGRRPFDVYARPWSGARGTRVAIVIGGLGVSQTGTQTAIQTLPAEVTLAFASGGNSLDRWMQAARQKGHELVLQVPMEPYDYPAVNPGRATLTVDADPSETIANLHQTLSRMTNYVGIMNYMGERFVTDRDAMAPVMRDLGARGLMYLDDGSSARSLAQEVAAADGVPFAASGMVIDQSRERADILKKLDDLERTSRAQGFAIASGSAFGTTIEAVTSWIGEAKQRGIEIVPVSAVADDPQRRQ